MKTRILLNVMLVAATVLNMQCMAKAKKVVTPTQTYSANAVYPTDIYCPTGQFCNVTAPTITMTVGASLGQTVKTVRK